MWREVGVRNERGHEEPLGNDGDIHYLDYGNDLFHRFIYIKNYYTVHFEYV